jgi:hypothetical protein
MSDPSAFREALAERRVLDLFKKRFPNAEIVRVSWLRQDGDELVVKANVDDAGWDQQRFTRDDYRDLG